jgi:hypothetical protein
MEFPQAGFIQARRDDRFVENHHKSLTISPAKEPSRARDFKETEEELETYESSDVLSDYVDDETRDGLASRWPVNSSQNFADYATAPESSNRGK